MDDKRLDEWLQSLKKDYEQQPTRTSTKQVMQAVQRDNQKKSKKWVPRIAIAVGMLLFIIVAIPMFDDFQQSMMTPEERMDQFFERKKQEYAQSLGVENVDEFIQVQRAEEILQQFHNQLYNQLEVDEEIDEKEEERYREHIASFLTTPKQIAEQETNEGRIFLIHEAYYHVQILNNESLAQYINHLSYQYSLEEQEVEDVITYQDNPDQLGVPEEIRDAVKAIKDNGYELMNHETRAEDFYLQTDYEWEIQHLQQVEGSEPYQELVSIHKQYSTEEAIDKELLFQIEGLYNQFPEERYEIFRDLQLANLAAWSLRQYLLGNRDYENYTEKPIPEMHREELYSFIEDYPNSIYWDAVNGVVKEFEANNWIPDEQATIDWSFWHLFFEEYRHLREDKFQTINKWPLIEATQDQYRNYEANNNTETLAELSANEVVSLFMYASVNENEELVHELTTDDFQADKEYDWYQVWIDTDDLIEVKVNKEEAVYDFFSLYLYDEGYLHISVELVKEDNVWKIENVYEK